MFRGVFVFVFFVTSPAFTAVVKELEDACRLDEFACGDGACVSFDRVCDGRAECADGSDEFSCPGGLGSAPLRTTLIKRSKRQLRSCTKNQWQCRDGTCIGFDGKCDGTVDCPDGSDETFPLCRKSQCQSNWFRCTYGACVDGTAPCNSKQECADNSDELLPRCRNQTDEVSGQFKCDNGQTIPAAEHCDGTVDCADGSDETVRTCAAKSCPAYLFQCAYGACVDQGADCNSIQECADGSDESDELCNRISPTKPFTQKPQTTGSCVLPPFPAHGRYTVGGVPDATPGQSFLSLQLNVTCNAGYGVIGESNVYCFDGSWSQPNFPQCVRFCQLKPHPSVEYFCVVSGDSVEGTRNCNSQEASGTVVRPQCRAPNYYFPGVLNLMQCIDGNWDYIAICNPGLIQNGTNITILIKDKVELFVSNFTYIVPLFNLPITPMKEKPVWQNFTSPNVNVAVTTESPSDYDIDENDWRIGRPSNVNVNIKNSSVIIQTHKANIRKGR